MGLFTFAVLSKLSTVRYSMFYTEARRKIKHFQKCWYNDIYEKYLILMWEN